MNAPVITHITAKGTVNIASESVVVSQIVFLCTGAGTAWTLAILDKASTPRTWFGPFTLVIPADGKPVVMFYDVPLYMEGGIDVITAGTTPGILDIQML